MSESFKISEDDEIKTALQKLTSAKQLKCPIMQEEVDEQRNVTVYNMCITYKCSSLVAPSCRKFKVPVATAGDDWQ